MNRFEELAEAIEAAKHFTDFFCSAAGEDLEAMYRDAAKNVHPDIHHGTPLEARAESVMARLNELHDAALGKRPPPPAFIPVTVTVKKQVYTVQAPICHGDFADIHDCEKVGETTPLVMKVARNSSDNDLMLAEYNNLKAIRSPDDNALRNKFTPSVIDSFVLSGKGGRRCTVMKKLEGMVTLEQIMKKKPGGLDYRDLAWMLKRSLSALGFVHATGYVYGAFLPEHVFVHPVEHGLRMTDWCFSVKKDEPLKAFSTKHKDRYPPEVFLKRPATPGLDIWMVADQFLRMLDGCEPPRFKRFLNGCKLAPSYARPGAFDLYEELSTLLLELVGKPKYRELVL